MTPRAVKWTFWAVVIVAALGAWLTKDWVVYTK